MQRGSALKRRTFFAGGLVGAILMALTPAILAGEEAQVVLKEGDRAPDFKLMGSDGAYHALADYKGVKPVVIAFFPKAFTGG